MNLKKSNRRLLAGKSFRIFMVCVVCGLLVAVFTGLTVMTNTITIHDGDQVYSITTTETDPTAIMVREGITLASGDHFELTEIVDRQANLYIVRPFEVSFTDLSETTELVMTTGTVQDVLDLMEVKMGEYDVLNYNTNDKLTADMHITVTRVRYEEYAEEIEIPFAEDMPSESLDIGESYAVEVAGETGLRRTTYRKTFINNTLVATDVVSDVILNQPVTAVYRIEEANFTIAQAVLNDDTFESGRNAGSTGTTQVHVANELRHYAEGSAPVELDENGIPMNYLYKVEGVASAYSNFGRPTQLAPGCVAMNQDLFPFGTKLYIRTPDGSYIYGYSKVADTGTAVNNGTVLVDVFFNTYEESAQFGLKDVEVYVLSYPEE